MANLNIGRKSGFIVRSGVRRRETVWFFLPFGSDTLAASATAILTASLNAAALELRPFTIVRTRLQWLCISDQSAASESFVGNFGMCIVSDQAIAVGVSSVPTPATDLGSDLWFLIDQWIGQVQLIGSDWSQNLQPRVLESKAMRKVDIGQDIAFVSEAGIGGNGVAVKTVGRILVKLH